MAESSSVPEPTTAASSDPTVSAAFQELMLQIPEEIYKLIIRLLDFIAIGWCAYALTFPCVGLPPLPVPERSLHSNEANFESFFSIRKGPKDADVCDGLSLEVCPHRSSYEHHLSV